MCRGLFGDCRRYSPGPIRRTVPRTALRTAPRTALSTVPRQGSGAYAASRNQAFRDADPRLAVVAHAARPALAPGGDARAVQRDPKHVGCLFIGEPANGIHGRVPGLFQDLFGDEAGPTGLRLR